MFGFPSNQIAPLLMVILTIIACTTYVFTKDYPRAVYWLAATMITVTVTWFIR